MPTRPGIPISRFVEIDSTQAAARRWTAAGNPAEAAAPRLLVAERQTGGIGRFRRTWHSPAGGLWMTLAWPDPDSGAASVQTLGLRVGVACLRAIAAVLDSEGRPISPMLRWPNDVLLEGRKVAGCLIEVVAGTAGPWALVGIGINANNNPADLPNDLRTPPTSLAREAGRPIDLEELLGAVTIELVRAMTWTPETDPEFFAGASASLVQCGREVTAVVPGGGRARGVLVGLNEAGQLVLEGTDPDRRRLVAPYGTELENSGGSAIPIA